MYLKFLDKLTIRQRLFILIFFIGGLCLVTSVTFSVWTINASLYKEKTSRLSNVINLAYKIIEMKKHVSDRNGIPEKQAKEEAKNIIKLIGTETNNYIFIADYENITMVMHPESPFLEGKDLSYLRDKKGTRLDYKILDIVANKGDGYLLYHWTKPNQDKNKYFPKLTYLKAFKDWKWVIGTGIYIDDLQHAIFKLTFIIIAVNLLVLCLIIFIVNMTIAKGIITPLEKISKISRKLANDEFDIEIPKDNNNTEIGALNRSFSKFVHIFKNNRENEKRISSILNSVIDGIIAIDEKGNIESSNFAVESLFGYTKDQIDNWNVENLIPDIMKLLTADSSYVCNLQHDCQRIETKGIKVNGESFDLSLGFSRLDLDEKAIYILAIQDITHKKEVERIKNEFISIVSHELRTPLTSIRGALGLVMHKFTNTLPENLNELLNIANNNCLRLIYLVNDILDIEKIESGKMKFELKEVDLNLLVETAIKANSTYAEQFNVIYQLGETWPVANVLGDKDRLLQVMTNLLSNAAKFSNPYTVVLISITREHGNFIRVSVQDTGCGVPEEFKDKIFQKFAQADSSDSRKKGGTGLGLSISKSIIDKMGGNIGFISVENVGSTFYFELPSIQ